MNNKVIQVEKNSIQHEEMLKVANKIFNIGAQAPDQVFQDKYGHFLFEEVDVILNRDFWDTVLKPLAKKSNDEALILGIFDNSQNNQRANLYFIFFPVEASGRDVWIKLTDESSGRPDSLYFEMRYSDSFMWFPLSGNWGIWASNCFGEQGILAVPEENTSLIEEYPGNAWALLDEAADQFLRQPFRNQLIPQEYLEKLTKNYFWKKYTPEPRLPLLSKQEDFDIIWHLITTVFHIKKTFPEQVFRESYQYFKFEEFGIFQGVRGWMLLLKQLALISEDDAVYCVVIKPTPVNDQFRAVKFATARTSGDNFWRTFYPNEKGEEFLEGETLVLLPPSGKWALWADQEIGISVIGFADEKVKQLSESLIAYWLTPHELQEEYGYKKRALTAEFVEQLNRNY